jgi:hypothetical protein
MSQWVIVVTARSAITWQEQDQFQGDDDEVRFVLDQHTLFDFFSATSLEQHYADRHVSPFLNIDILESKIMLGLLCG